MRLLADHCDLYNAALAERREAWRMRQVSISYGMQSAQLKEIRQADPDGQGRHSCTAQQQTLRRLNTVFAAFFDRARTAEKAGEGKRPGHPRFKPYQRFSQVLFVAGDGAKWQPSGSGPWAHATFQAVGTLKVHQHRPVRGTVKALRLKREHRRWYVIVIAETAPVPLPAAGREVGVDLGVARFLTTSDGEVVANAKFLATSAQVIADLERRKARARPGSGNRKRIRRALAREWRTVRNRRRDFHHKTARALVNQCDAIALEKLNTAGMTRRPAPRPDPDTPGAFLPNHPRRGLGAVHQYSHRQSGRSWPASDTGEPGRDEHHLLPLRTQMRTAAAEDRHLPRSRPGRRRRERGTEHRVQGRAGLWSGSHGSLRSCRNQAAEQSRLKCPPSDLR